MFNSLKSFINSLFLKMKDSNSIESQNCLKLNAKLEKSVKESKVKETLVISKFDSENKQLLKKAFVLVKRLTPNEIKRFDKQFYKIYSNQLKAQNECNKNTKLRHNLNKVNENQRMHLWKSSSPQKVVNNYTICRNKSKFKTNYYCDERECCFMNLSQFSRYLNLINCKELKRIPEQTLKMDFNIRNVAKTGFVKKDQNHNIVIKSDSLMKNMFDIIPSQKLKLKPKKKLKQKKLNFAIKKIKQKYKLMQNQNFCNKYEKQLSEQRMKCLSAFPLVSPMGQRVFQSLNNECLDSNKVQTIINENELFCSTKIRVLMSSETEKLNKWKCNNIEKIASGTDFTTNGSLVCHQYSFNRRQRLDKIKTFQTGINWRSRLLALKVPKNLSIDLKKCILCPICKITIKDNHCCHLYDKQDFQSNKSLLNVPINKSTNSGKQKSKLMRTQTKPYNTRSGSDLKLNNKSQKPFDKKEKMDFKNRERVLSINLDKDDNRKVLIDLDIKEN